MTPMLSSAKLNRLGSVYRDCLSRYKSVFILYTVVLAVVGPVFLLPDVLDYMSSDREYFYSFSTEWLFHFAALALACLLPLLLFSYINSRQAVDVYHAMPVTRDKLYWGNVLGGATILLAPYLLLGIPCGIVCSLMDSRGRIEVLGRVLWIALGILAMYATMVFIMVNCGTLFESIVYYGIVQLAYPLMILAVMESLGEFTFGWQESINSGIPGFLVAFAPGYMLVDVIFGNGYTGWQVIVQQAATITAALFFGAVLYRRRRSESAGSAFAFKPLFYLGAVMVSVTAGVGCYLIFDNYSGLMVAISVIVGVLCYFILDTIRNRGLSHVKETALVSLGGVVAVGMFYGLACLTGTFGYEDRVPAAVGVKSVSVQWSAGSESYLSRGFAMTDEANIARVIATHEAIVENKKAIEDYHETFGLNDTQEPVKDGYIRYRFDNGSGDGWDYGTGRVTVKYTMIDGRTVSRQYNDVPLTLTQPLYQAAASGEYRNLQWIGLKEALLNGDFDKADSWSFSVQTGNGWEGNEFTNAMAADLAEAMVADLESRPDDWNVHPDSAPISDMELYPNRYSSSDILANYSMNIYERDRNTIAWMEQHGYAVGDGYVSSSGQDIVAENGEITAVTEPMPTIDYEITYGTEVYEHTVAVLRASDRDTLWADCKELFHFGGYDSWQSDFEKMGDYTFSVMITEKDLDELRSKASSHYISDEPRDVLIIDGNSYLIYPEYSEWMHEQGYTLTK